MTEEIAGLLGVKIDVVAKLVQWVAAIIGVVAFLVFFALAPLHALILSGLLIVLASLYFKADKSIQRMAFYVGVGFMVLGFVGIFIPALTSQLLAAAKQLRQLLLVG